MSASPVRLILAAALAAGAAFALPAPASAAPKQCAIGKWRLVKYSLIAKGETTSTVKGGAGTKLTVTPKKFAYDFTGSKKVVLKTAIEGTPITVNRTYRKRLAFKSTLKGAKKGKFSLRAKSASGNAVVRSTFNGTPTDPEYLVKIYRKGDFDPFIVPYGNYACTAKVLKFQSKHADETGTSVVSATYRRI
ncbi:hypothetical protein GCM10010439_59140 [Actinocorallia aurantiaca]|uniref:Uncharacterized protein n=1 Tax=Actinocorallia aurantiaca TaxID=46204 RepID=A0ABN3UMK5_9ACTN